MIKIYGERCLVKKVDLHSTVQPMIHIVKIDDQEPRFGEVLAVGKLKLRDGSSIPMEVKRGDMVVLKQYCGAPVTYKGENLHIVEYEDVLAIVEA